MRGVGGRKVLWVNHSVCWKYVLFSLVNKETIFAYSEAEKKPGGKARSSVRETGMSHLRSKMPADQ